MLYHSKFQFILNSIRLESPNNVDQDRSLANLFLKTINPLYGWANKAYDGHCSNCAFNVYMFLSGFKLNRSFMDNDNEFMPISTFIYNGLYSGATSELQLEKDGPINKYKMDQGEGYRKILGYHRLQADYAVYLHCIKYETNCVIVSIAEGTHWYAAFYDGCRTWFIDAQTGKGFNLYDEHDDLQRMPTIDTNRFKKGKDNEYSRFGSTLTFISFSNEQLVEFLSKNPRLAQLYSPQVQPIKPGVNSTTRPLSFPEYVNRQNKQNPRNADYSYRYQYGKPKDDFAIFNKPISATFKSDCAPIMRKSKDDYFDY
ncbi:hypothetical protein FRA_44c11680 [Francisella sp. W12-1067]|nr:hypothetical protein FRA_44c11680 [Francisella sp. W12-1067]